MGKTSQHPDTASLSSKNRKANVVENVMSPRSALLAELTGESSQKPKKTQYMLSKLQKMQQKRERRIGLVGRAAASLRVVESTVSRARNDKHKDQDWGSLLRRKEFHIMSFSMLGLFGSIAMNVMRWYARSDPATNFDDIYVVDYNANMVRALLVLYILQFIISFTTAATVVLIVQYYQMKVEEKCHEWSGLHFFDVITMKTDSQVKREFKESYSWKNSYFLRKCCVEIFVHLWHPILWMNPNRNTRALYNVCFFLMFSRLYVVLRVILGQSVARRLQNDILAATPSLLEKNYNVSLTSVIKISFYKRPVTVTVLLTLLSLFFLGVLMFTAEHLEQPETFGRFENCIWFVWVTWSTCGYGDLLPTTTLGRLVVVLIGLSNLTIISLVNAVITNLIARSREQRYVGDFMAVRDATQKYKEAAACLIQNAYRYHRMLRQREAEGEEDVSQSAPFSVVLRSSIKNLRRCRSAVTHCGTSVSDPVLEQKVDQLLRGMELLGRDAKDISAHAQQMTAFIREQCNVIRQHHMNNQCRSIPEQHITTRQMPAPIRGVFIQKSSSFDEALEIPEINSQYPRQIPSTQGTAAKNPVSATQSKAGATTVYLHPLEHSVHGQNNTHREAIAGLEDVDDNLEETDSLL